MPGTLAPGRVSRPPAQRNVNHDWLTAEYMLPGMLLCSTSHQQELLAGLRCGLGTAGQRGSGSMSMAARHAAAGPDSTGG